MAFDFPASPTNGTLYQPAGGPTYRYDSASGGWTVAQPASNMAFIGDGPPTSPAPVNGQLWWESDTGALYVYFSDANSSQWVQINGPQLLSDAPSDGAEYVRVNGVWRQKSISVSLAGVTMTTGINIAVPTGVRACRYNLYAGTATALAFNMGFRLSADGTTFLSGASDYTYSGSYWIAGSSTALTAYAVQSNSWSYIGIGNNLGSGYAAKIEGSIMLAKVNAATDYTSMSHSSTHQANQYEGIINQWMASAASDNVLAWKAVQFAGYNAPAGVWSEGHVEVNWIY